MKTMEVEKLSLVSGGARAALVRDIVTTVVVDGIISNGMEAARRTYDRAREETQERREGQDCRQTRRGTRCS